MLHQWCSEGVVVKSELHTDRSGKWKAVRACLSSPLSWESYEALVWGKLSLLFSFPAPTPAAGRPVAMSPRSQHIGWSRCCWRHRLSASRYVASSRDCLSSPSHPSQLPIPFEPNGQANRTPTHPWTQPCRLPFTNTKYDGNSAMAADRSLTGLTRKKPRQNSRPLLDINHYHSFFYQIQKSINHFAKFLFCTKILTILWK